MIPQPPPPEKGNMFERIKKEEIKWMTKKWHITQRPKSSKHRSRLPMTVVKKKWPDIVLSPEGSAGTGKMPFHPNGQLWQLAHSSNQPASSLERNKRWSVSAISSRGKPRTLRFSGLVPHPASMAPCLPGTNSISSQDHRARCPSSGC